MSKSVFAPWIGRQEGTHDQLSRNLVKRIAATLGGPTPAHGEALPPLWRWVFFQDPVEAADLGVGGHPVRGGSLPSTDDRNRMRTGERLKFHQPLRASDEASHTSTIPRAEEKHRRSGALLFAALRHDYRQDGQLMLGEEHDIVYRGPAPPKLGDAEALPEGDWREAPEPDPVLLFRYSAMTFNSHHIHYDWSYVTDAEGYPGLVVHGPLVATLALRAFCRANPQARLHRFACRGLRPLICPEPFEVGGRLLAADKAEVWVGNGAGLAQRGDVEFD